MRALKICLWVTGVLCLLSVVGMFLPVSAFESIAKFFGAESLPDSPVVRYAIRTASATYVGVRMFFVILALNPAKYGLMVPFSGLCAIFIGVVCAVTGIAAGRAHSYILAKGKANLPPARGLIYSSRADPKRVAAIVDGPYMYGYKRRGWRRSTPGLRRRRQAERIDTSLIVLFLYSPFCEELLQLPAAFICKDP